MAHTEKHSHTNPCCETPKKVKPRVICAALLALCGRFLVAYAEDIRLPHYIPLQKHGAYDVEVLVFSRGTHIATEPVDNIQWLDTTGAIQLQQKPADWPEWRWPSTDPSQHEDEQQAEDNNIPPSPEPQKPQVLVDYQRDDLFLQKTASKLANQPGWRVLLHRKWRLQPSDFKQPVYLDVSTTIPFPAQLGESSSPASEVNLSSHVDTAVTEDPLPATSPTIMPGLYGKLAFSKGRYLHIDARLQRITTEPYPQVATLTEKRRVHSNVLQYFDHPDFGILVRITPIEEPPQPLPAESNHPEQRGL